MVAVQGNLNIEEKLFMVKAYYIYDLKLN